METKMKEGSYKRKKERNKQTNHQETRKSFWKFKVWLLKLFTCNRSAEKNEIKEIY